MTERKPDHVMTCEVCDFQVEIATVATCELCGKVVCEDCAVEHNRGAACPDCSAAAEGK